MVSMEINNQFSDQHRTVKMSQFWHARWAEDGFKPTRLQNWEVPRWHAEWPDRHCTTTKFEAHQNGRLFASAKKCSNPWGNFKGTWELPLKIDRRTAEELSRSSEYKKVFWDAHRAKHQRICKGACTDLIVTSSKSKNNEDKNKKEKEKKSQDEKNDEFQKEDDNNDINFNDNDELKEKCKIKKTCKL